jgi:hypothetical protein
MIAIRSADRSRARRLASAGFCLAWLLALGGSAAAQESRPDQLPYHTPGAIPTLDSGYLKAPHRVVRIENHALFPRRVVLEDGEHVVWIGRSSAPSVIIFEREVAREMVCRSLVNFRLHEDELLSGPVHAGEVASFCELAPGRYRYKVVRRGHERGDGVSAARRLEGVIEVRSPGVGEGARVRP